MTDDVYTHTTALSSKAGSAAQYRSIGLALSGGGFRATLLHLGVIARLKDAKLLGSVTHICSVSGGSVLAAHLVLFWDQYALGDLEQFHESARKLVKFCREQDVTGRIVRKSQGRLLRGRPMSTELLAKEYISLLDRPADPKANQDLRKGVKYWNQIPLSWPRLDVLCTYMNTGERCSFSRDGFILKPGSDRNDVTANSQLVARGVAASSAFPPVFEPITPCPPRDIDTVTDGGVYDNSGVGHLKDLIDCGKASVDLVIASDGGRPFLTDWSKAYRSILSVAERVTDSQGNRVAESDRIAAKAFFENRKIPFLDCRIDQSLQQCREIEEELQAKNPAMAKTFAAKNSTIRKRGQLHTSLLQQRVANIRTDFDRFSEYEIYALFCHGYFLVDQQLAKLDPERFPLNAEVPTSHSDCLSANRLDRSTAETLQAALESSHERGNLSKLFKIRHPGGTLRSIAAFFVLMFVIALPGIILLGAIVAAIIFFSRGPAPMIPHGELAVERILAPADIEKFPILADLKPIEGKMVFESAPISSLTSNRPHLPATLKLGNGAFPELYGTMTFYFALAETVGSETHYVVLGQGATGTFVVPAGAATDRILVVIVFRKNPAGVADEARIKGSFKITLENQ